MNKAELINAVAAAADVSKKDAEAVIAATVDTIIHHFGTTGTIGGDNRTGAGGCFQQYIGNAFRMISR